MTHQNAALDRYNNLWNKADHMETSITKLIEQKLDAANAQAEAMAADDEAAAKKADRLWHDLNGQVKDLEQDHAAVTSHMQAMEQAECAV